MNTITIVEGQYTPKEAKEMLLSMLNDKINFHKIKNLSSEMRYGQPDHEAHEQIKILSETKEHILSIIQKGLNSNSNLKIESTIRIAFEDGLQTKEVCLEKGAC